MQTENGAPSLATTSDSRLDFFFKTVRNQPREAFDDLFMKSWNQDPLSTLKMVFHLRDIRGGKGEKRLFHWSLENLLKLDPETVRVNLHQIPEFGTYKDLFYLQGTPLESEMVSFFTSQLHEGNLSGKWAPTEGGKWNALVSKFCSALGLTKKGYRQLLVSLREKLKIVEHQISTKQYFEINYNHIPSIAMHRYAKLFQKYDSERFEEYLKQVRSGKAKMNTGVLYPAEILFHSENNEFRDTQWSAYVKQFQEKHPGLNGLAIIDVSGSMLGIPMNNAIALGLLLATVSSDFGHHFMTFSTEPKLISVNPQDPVSKQIEAISRSNWNMTTNLQAAFQTILISATMWKLRPEQMPSVVYIFSDMQFNQACPERTNFQVIDDMYREAGYVRPKLVFWNLRGDTIDFPVSSEIPNCVLLSGYSPNLLEAVLDTPDSFTPWNYVEKLLNSERYSELKLA